MEKGEDTCKYVNIIQRRSEGGQRAFLAPGQRPRNFYFPINHCTQLNYLAISLNAIALQCLQEENGTSSSNEASLMEEEDLKEDSLNGDNFDD